jgi:hypothetical protein
MPFDIGIFLGTELAINRRNIIEEELRDKVILSASVANKTTPGIIFSSQALWIRSSKDTMGVGKIVNIS